MVELVANWAAHPETGRDVNRAQPPTGANTTGTRRDPRIDFWRGLCVVGMIAWHLFSHPAFPRYLSFPLIQALNFVAEGFVLLAGLSVGLLAARSPERACLIGRWLRRAGLFLIVHYALNLVLIALGFASPSSNATSRYTTGSLLAVLTLSWQPYLGDVLSLFAFLSLLTPLILRLRRKLGDTGILVFSTFIGIGTLLIESCANWPRPHSIELNATGAFDVNTWQMVYVAGIVIGGRYEAILAAIHRSFARTTCLFLCLFATLFILRMVIDGRPAWIGLPPVLFTFQRHPLGLPRLLYILAQIGLVGLLTIRLWPTIADTVAIRIFQTFGRASLIVFVASVFLDYAAKLILDQPGSDVRHGLLACAVVFPMLYFLARYVSCKGVRPPALSPEK